MVARAQLESLLSTVAVLRSGFVRQRRVQDGRPGKCLQRVNVTLLSGCSKLRCVVTQFPPGPLSNGNLRRTGTCNGLKEIL